ncbi:MAG TPA: hypothetical protein VGV92_08405 [Gammaproteobacteria bacterium]|nr:hypothetical protein [Gammaproteobacteria bacterium]
MSQERSCKQKAISYGVGGGLVAVCLPLFVLMTRALVEQAADLTSAQMGLGIAFDVVLGIGALTGATAVTTEAFQPAQGWPKFWQSCCRKSTDATVSETTALQVQTQDAIAKVML